MRVMDTLRDGGYEQLLTAVDAATGLRAYICIHDTTLGPALGGVRIWPHATEEDALADVLRLSRAMTFKSAAAGLDFGGGKGLIWADAAGVTEAQVRAFARHVQSLGGRYITTEDVGVTGDLLAAMSEETEHVVGLPAHLGGSGNTSSITGYGVFNGLLAAVEAAWGTRSLDGAVVALQGFGKVASALAEHLLAAGASLTATDVSAAARERARAMGCAVLDDPDAIYDAACDVFAPCALGGVLNAQTIARLRCGVVAGAANNQLASPEDGAALWRRGIVYAPDFIINAGGVINLAVEAEGYAEETALARAAGIADAVAAALRTSREQGIPPHEAAERLALDRLERARAEQASGGASPGARYVRVRTAGSGARGVAAADGG